MTSTQAPREYLGLDADALLCALVLAPRTYPRNRFFALFEDPIVKRIQRRAKRVRGIIRQLAGHGQPAGEITGEQVLDDRVLLRYQLAHLNYERTTSLSTLEAALVQYAMKRAKREAVGEELTVQIETALRRLDPPLNLEALQAPKPV